MTTNESDMPIVTDPVPNAQDLINGLASIPDNWKLTPVKAKRPLRPNWQKEEPLPNPELISELNTGKWDGYDLRTGDVSGGLLAIDVDGATAQNILDKLETIEKLPDTVSWTSGKKHRKQLLFQIPDHYREKFKSFGSKSITEYVFNGELLKTACDSNGKPIEELDFRYNGHQSVIPPSKHPETGRYSWVNSPNNSNVALAPDWLCDFILNLENSSKREPVKQNKTALPNYQRGDKTFLDECIENIPIDQLGWHDWRDMMLALNNEGYSENEALSISRRSSKHTDKGFYDVWNYIKNDKTNNITGGTLYHLATELGNFKPKNTPKNNVVSINKNNPKANEFSTLSDDLKALLDEGLSGSNLEFRLLEIGKKYGYQKRDVRGLYDRLSSEKEKELGLGYQKEVLDKLENKKVVNLNEVLPEKFAKALAAIAKAYGVSESVLLTCLLPVACSQLNPDMRLTLRTSSKQQARPIFWGIIGGDPGSAKTPCLNLFTDPVKKIQKMEKERFDLDQEYYEKRRKEWEKLNKKEQQNEPEPEPPKPMKRKLIGKATFEAVLRVQVKNQDDSLLWAKDEMSELFNEFGQYKGGKGSDRQVLLSMSTGEGFSLDRVKEYLFAERSTTSIVGGIQPGILKKHMGDMQDEDGLFSRFCFDFIPSETPNKIEDGEVIPDVSGWLDDIYSRLRAIPPQTFTFEDEAQKKYNHWYNALDDARLNEPRGAMKGIYAKYKTLTGVVALALHCLWAAIEGQSPSNKVSGEALYMAKKMMNLYLSNIKTFYQTASEDETAPLERILALSAKTDDYISATEVKQRDRFFKKISPDTIRAYFTDLTLMGKGEVTGKGKAIRFKKLDTFKGNLTENRQKLDKDKIPQNLTTTTVSEIISTKLDKLDNFSQANSEKEPSPPVVIPDEVLPTKENVYLSSESPQPQTQQASQPLDTVSSSVYSSQDLSSNRSEPEQKQSEDFKAGDRATCMDYPGQFLEIKDIHHGDSEWLWVTCQEWHPDRKELAHISQLTKVRAIA